jgi:mRNA interferase MazF
VLITQSDAFNRTRIDTIIVIALSSNLKLAGLPGNVRLSSQKTGLKKDSVINVTQLAAIGKDLFIERVGFLERRAMERVEDGLRSVLSLP